MTAPSLEYIRRSTLVMCNAGMNNDVSSARAFREFVFLVGADLIYQGRKVKVRLALPKPDRPEFLKRLRTVSDGLPIAAQLEWSTSGNLSAQPDHVIPRLPSFVPPTAPPLSP